MRTDRSESESVITATADKPRRRVLFCVAMTAALAAAGALMTAGTATPGQHVVRASGTLQVAMPAGPASDSTLGVRLTSVDLPSYVSTGTAHASLFIDHAATPAGATTTCAASNGTGTGCTISWTANLTVPASHVFSVEIDTGPSILPHNTVLAEGQAT